MIKEFKTGKAQGLFVEVPQDASNFGFMFGICTVDTIDNGKVKHKWLIEVDEWMNTIPKNQKIEALCLTLTATEEDAKKIVDDDIDFFPDCYESYIIGEPRGTATCFSAKASLRSLLQYVGLDTSKNYAVLIKVKP